jgi:nucleotide-binding universal stress UspA family protein
MPMMLYPPVAAGEARVGAVHDAEEHAAEVAHRAHLDDADPIGTTGDSAAAILRDARGRDVDVIVVGNHEHSWFARPVTGSVKNEILRLALVLK